LRLRRKVGWSLLVSFGLLLLFEGVARIFDFAECGPVEPDAGDWEEMVGDRNTLWKMRSNYEIPSPHGPATRMNALGLREELLPESHGGHRKAKQERRLITIGDSSVYGWGVPTGQTFQEVLERQLKARWPSFHFEVINLGVPGYSTEQSRRQLDEVGWAYEPDLLVFSSIFSDSNFDHFQDVEALRLANPAPTGLSAMLQSSRCYCSVYMSIQNRIARRGQQANRVLMPGVPRDARWVTDADRFGVDARVPIGRFQENVGAIIQRAKTEGVETILAPLAQEWDAGRWSMPQLPQPEPNTPLPWTPYREVLRTIAHEKGLVHVPFYEAFAKSQLPAHQLFSDAIHPTPKGAQLMAQELFRAIESNPGLLRLPIEEDPS